MSALVLPVVRVPSCARGPPGVLFTAHPHMYNKSVLQYCRRYIKNDDHEPRTTNHQIPFNRKDCKKAPKSTKKTLQKTLPAVYSRIYRIFDRKCSQRGDFGVSLARIRCPLEYILSVGGRFWNFFFPGTPKKTPTFFTISLSVMSEIVGKNFKKFLYCSTVQ